MHIRSFRFQSRNPVVVIAMLSVVLALFAFFLSAMLAIGAGAAVLGGVGYGVRRLHGRRPHLRDASVDGLSRLDPAREVFPDPALPVKSLPGERLDG